MAMAKISRDTAITHRLAACHIVAQQAIPSLRQQQSNPREYRERKKEYTLGISLRFSFPSFSYLLYTSSGQQGGNPQRQQQQQPQEQPPAGLFPPAVMQLYYNNAGRTPYNATLWLKRLVRDLSLKQKATQALAEQLQQQQLTEQAGEALEQQKEKENETEEQEQLEKEQQQAQKEEPEQLRNTRDVSLNMDLLDIVGVSNTDNNNNNSNDDSNGEKKAPRTKRQSSTRSTLCETTSQFITPQAALNSHGNWMFVVNEENTARQMVKAELCA